MARSRMRGVSQVCWSARSLHSWSQGFTFRRFVEGLGFFLE